MHIAGFCGREAVVITCPKCSAKYQLKDVTKPAKVRCKKCQAVMEVQPPDMRQRSEMKTAAPPQSATPRSEVKTQIPSPADDASSRAEMKTAVPPAAADPGDPRQRSEMATAIPDAADKARQASEMRTLASDTAPPPASAGSGVPLLGKTLGGYEVLRKLGEGGMGAVYEARQIALDRSVALKVLPAHLAANTDFIRRFSREALSVAKLNHNNIIQIYDIGKEEGTYFFSMEFVRGTSIGDIIEKEGKMDTGRAVGYILQSARGLEYAHRYKIIHRDIKPDNIMINEDDIAKVADLGLAKQMGNEDTSMTVDGVGMGTPVYMSPEQGSDAKNVDHRADIYSLGCTLYHMITGKIPYDGESAYEIITKHVNEPFRPPSEIDPDISDEMSGIIGKMMAKTKEERYQSMIEVVEALEGYLGVDYAQAGFVPTEGQISTLQEHSGAVAGIAGSNVLKLAGLVIGAIVVVLALVAIVGMKPVLLVATILYALTAYVLYAFFLGTGRKTYLYRRIRKHIFGNKLSDWITMVVVLLAAAALIVPLAPAAIAGLVLGLITAAGLFFGVKKPLLKKLDAAIEEVKKLTREFRRKGIPDESIDLFVARHGGKYGEVVCEELSGYDAVLATRAKRSQEELEKTKRPLYYSVREGIIHWLDRAEEKREAEKRAATTPAAEAAAAAEGAAPAGAATAETEAYIAEIIEEKKPKANPAVAIPKFILGSKGRVTIGAILLLLSVLCLSNTAFDKDGVLGNFSFVALAVALMFSGFVHAKAMIALLLLSAAASAVTLAQPDLASLGKSVFGADATEWKAKLTLGLVAAAALFILAFVAGFLFRGGKEDKKDAKVGQATR